MVVALALEVIKLASLDLKPKVVPSRVTRRDWPFYRKLKNVAMEIIKSHNISKKYRKQSEFALQNVSFTVQQKEIVGLIGPNGAGKSTLIKILLGVLKPTSGTVEVLGTDPMQASRSDRLKMGVYLGGKSNLIYHLSILDSVKYYAVMYEVPRAVFTERLKLYAQLFSIADILSQKVATLSLGQRLRAELLCVFIYNPDLVFLDEPTLGLDIEGKRVFRELLQDAKNHLETTILLTTHDINELEKVADRFLLLQKGQLVFDTEYTELRKTLEQRVVILTDVELSAQEPVLIERNRGLNRYLLPASALDTVKDQIEAHAFTHFQLEKATLEDILYEFFA